MTLHAAAIAFGFLLAAIAGGSLQAGARVASGTGRVERIILGAAAGLPLLAAVVFLFSVCGIPVTAVSLAMAMGTVSAAAVAAWRLSRPAEAEGAPFVSGPSLFSTIVLLTAAAVSISKMVRAPLWSWDHFAIWGANARRFQLAADSLGPIRFFRFHLLFQDYLSGLACLWRGLVLGTRPSPADFKLCHVLFALMLLVAARRAAALSSGSATVGNVLAAWLAASPLFWDTEAVGLADLPLALFSAAALVFLPGASKGRRTVPFWICVAALPWIKNEGLPLSAGILCAAALSPLESNGRRRRLARFAMGFVLIAAGAGAWRFFQFGETPTFFQGDWIGRAASRLPALPHIAWRMGVELARPGWLGIWPAAGLAMAVSVARRDRRSGPLWAMVLLPLSADLGVYLATYLPPEAHIASSFGRICGALVPALFVALAAVLAGSRAGAERNLPPAVAS